MLVPRPSLVHARPFKYIIFLTVLVAFINILQSKSKIYEMPIKSFITEQSVLDLLAKNECFIPTSMKKINWHDNSFIKYERKRKGLGEQGKSGYLKIKKKYLLNDQVFQSNVLLNDKLSDKISLNRSLPDIRYPECKKKLYMESLPSVSVVIPFHNEHFKTLLRTLHSIINRSPKQLLKEVLLVDDASTIKELKEDLESYVVKYLPKVKILRAEEQHGLIRAKLLGAKEATADALVFLEAHIEVNVNWLPPLLEPIALNYRTVMCPTIDLIDKYSFEYKEEDQGHRGGFNWKFYYKKLPLLPNDTKHMPEPFATPVMEGSIFAISRIFFWELGGFDPGLYMWGGEQFEISFKIWQCGGRMLKAPCSRLGHINLNHDLYFYNGNCVERNYCRVAQVWMDEYAVYILDYYSNFHTKSDISEQKALRKKLQCNSFQWYMTQIAFDLQLFYPPVEPPSLASGKIRSLFSEDLCVEADFMIAQLALNQCYFPYTNQDFFLTWKKDIRTKVGVECWDLPNKLPMSPVHLYKCHNSRGNQQWHYDMNTKQIFQGKENCLDHNPHSFALYVKPCDRTCLTQMWDFDSINTDMLSLWDINPSGQFEFTLYPEYYLV